MRHGRRVLERLMVKCDVQCYVEQKYQTSKNKIKKATFLLVFATSHKRREHTTYEKCKSVITLYLGGPLLSCGVAAVQRDRLIGGHRPSQE